ncbi:hypothetical protein vBAbaMPhT2_189 [Acinetobacter phage vB_AbaM_PhT2]|uniref:Uncharacterized protein n=2 Tax=Hadassahvirus TaxID=2842716 RepID=A0A6B9SYY1_9CAUD|nr:tail fiber protein [Acinetobacter phage AbTZA1]YP_009887206.1 tail fiber protein [Acinetobacter phage vB_AbaM_PhT2]QQM13884.1 hypothetical protein CPT_Maestro_155 [Acinetobacter phage Maestro]QQM18638.1 hypothetical protein CPT_Morttis_150 [Acinetobacter phage Morttis]UQS94220.1 hypothetical protein ABNavy71_149 [Acinetobacter phage AB-Navy71]SSU39196.1 Uncharacterised protein [Acinetobacter baumannii]AZU98614.1 hypothetical protein [Acinetobacter phage AbTZA1]
MTTIARALVTLKRNRAVFADDLREMRFCGVFRNGLETSTGIKTAEFVEQSRKNVQSVKDKLTAEFDLRVKINKANFETMVDVGDKRMSINDALTYRTHILPQLKALHSRLVKELAAARSSFINIERDYDAKVAKFANDDEFKQLLEQREKPSIMDIQKEIDELKTTIDFFDLEFDAILTETNPTVVLD